MDELKRILGDPVDRRRFLKRMGAAGLGVAALALLDGAGNGLGLVQNASAKNNKGGSGGTGFSSADFPNIPGNNITQVVLNYALTLEILEADLYRQALNQAAGFPLTAPLFEDPFTYDLAISDGGLGSDAATAAFDYLVEFAYIEAAHRDFLITTLTSLKAPITSANAAGYAFPSGPGNSLQSILTNILPLEETGVRAYLGATPYLFMPTKGSGGNNNKNTSGSSTGNNTILTAAASIYSTEARHSAVIKFLLGQMPDPTMMTGDQTVVPNPPAPNVFEYFQTPTQVLTAASVYFKSSNPS